MYVKSDFAINGFVKIREETRIELCLTDYSKELYIK